MKHLLSMSAKYFSDLSNPFDAAVLSEHNVTLDECGDLSEAVAHAIRFYLKTPEKVRSSIEAASVFTELKDKVPALEEQATITEIRFLAEAANRCLQEATQLLGKWKTEEVGQLNLPPTVLDGYIKTINELNHNIHFLMSFVRVNVITKVVENQT